MKIFPEVRRFGNPMSLGNLERELEVFLSEEGFNIIRYSSKKGERYACITRWNPLIVRDILPNQKINSMTEILDSGVLEAMKNKVNGFLGEERVVNQWQLLSPVTPKKIIGVGYNYESHSREVGGRKKGGKIVFFNKDMKSHIGPFNGIEKPEEIKLMDYEVELGVVLSKDILPREATSENYPNFIAGYVLANDFSARDVQIRRGTLFDKTGGFEKAKGFEGFCPLGPVFFYPLDKREKRRFELKQFIN